MNAHSIIVLCLGSITLSVGLYHLTFYLRTRIYKENRCFAGMCFSIFLYDIFSAALYNSTNVCAGAVNQKWQSISIALLGIFGVRFTSNFIEGKKRYLDCVFITYWLMQICALLFDRQGLTWTNEPDIKQVSFFNLRHFTYYEVKPGILMMIMSAVGILASIYIIISLLRYYLKGHKRKTRPILIGIAFLVFGILHDSAITANIHHHFYVLEYSYMFLVIAMAYSIADTYLTTRDYLLASEEKYRGLVENVPDIVFSLDREGKLTSINEHGSELLGFSPSELIGQPLVKFTYPEDRTALLNRLEQARSLKQKRPPRLKFRLVGKEENIFWISLNSSITYNHKGNFLQEQGVARDITSMTTTQEELSKLAAAVESAEESIVITDLDGNIVYVNPRFERMTGYSREEIIGKSSGILSGDTHNEEFYKDLWQTIKSGETWHGHFTNRKKDGTLFEEEATISPISDPNGVIINYVAVKRDVTQQIALEGQLRHSQKMEAIGQLAGKIAHDFTNALVIIMGNAQLAKAKLPPGSEVIPHLEDINKSSQKVSEMTRELLAFAHRARVAMKNKDINRVLQSVADILKVSLGENIKLNLKTTKEPLMANLDQAQIEEVLVHLAVNARDSIAKEGNITIETSREMFTGSELRQIEDVFNADSTVPVEFAVIAMTDNGSGMPEDVRRHVFDPFFTTKKSSTGLGLSTVHVIIKQHNGCITVSSEPGVGTTFKIFIPILNPRENGPDCDEANLKNFGRNKSVLVVDNDTNACALSAGMFRRMKYRVTEIRTGAEAIRLLENPAEPVDIVVVDISSLNTGGKRLLDYCDIMTAPPTVILTSPHGRYHLELTGVIEETDLFTSKPFSFCSLAGILGPIYSSRAKGITQSRPSDQ